MTLMRTLIRTITHARRGALALLVAGMVAGGLVLSSTPTAKADYGPGALYQIEISANLPGPGGGGVWLWIGLNADHTGDYAGSDCGHGEGAVVDKGDVTWTQSAGQLTITGVTLNGLKDFPTTITVPAAYGHYSYPSAVAVLTLPIPVSGGFTQLQVAP